MPSSEKVSVLGSNTPTLERPRKGANTILPSETRAPPQYLSFAAVPVFTVAKDSAFSSKMTIDSACEGTRVILPSLVATAPLNNFSVAVKPPIEAFSKVSSEAVEPATSPAALARASASASGRRISPPARTACDEASPRARVAALAFIAPRESSPHHAWGQGAGGSNSATNERRRRTRCEGEIRDAPRSLPGRKREGTRLTASGGRCRAKMPREGMRSVSCVIPVCNTPNVQAGQNLSRMRRDSGIGLNNALFLQRLLARHPHSLPRSDERTEEHRFLLRRRRREGQRASAGQARRR